MRYRRLGSTDLVVSAVGFGAWAASGMQWGRVDEDDAIRAIRRALDLGVTFFDTADVYGLGHSEEVVGRALGRDRDRVVLATKVGLHWDTSGGSIKVWKDCSAAHLAQAVEHSLKRLGTDVIDLYQVHWPDPGTPLAETMASLTGLVEQGKVRYIGLSNFSLDLLREACALGSVAAVQTSYHLLDRQAEPEMLPYCRAAGIGVVAYGPLAHGLLAGRIDENTVFGTDDWRSRSKMFTGEGLKAGVEAARGVARLAAPLGKQPAQLAIAWVLANPAVDVAIAGAKTPAQVEENVGGDFIVPSRTMEALDALVRERQWKGSPFW